MAVQDEWILACTYQLSMIPKPDHKCSSQGTGVRTTIKCVDNSKPHARWRGSSLYKFFQRPVGGGGLDSQPGHGTGVSSLDHPCPVILVLVLDRAGRLLIGYTFSGVGNALVFLDRPVEVVAVMPWGSEWTDTLLVTGVRQLTVLFSVHPCAAWASILSRIANDGSAFSRASRLS